MNRWWYPLLPCLLSHCASSPEPVRAQVATVREAQAARVRLSLQVDQVLAGGRRAPVRPGQVLRNGDRFALTVTVDRQAYIYVVQVLPGRTSAVLFPGEREGDPLATPARPLTIPPQGESFLLDDSVGSEEIYVIASTRPLSQADPELARYLRLTHSASTRGLDTADPPPPPPPIPVKSTDRGNPIPGNKDDPAQRMQTDEGGMAVLRFPFRHESRRQ